MKLARMLFQSQSTTVRTGRKRFHFRTTRFQRSTTNFKSLLKSKIGTSAPKSIDKNSLSSSLFEGSVQTNLTNGSLSSTNSGSSLSFSGKNDRKTLHEIESEESDILSPPDQDQRIEDSKPIPKTEKGNPLSKKEENFLENVEEGEVDLSKEKSLERLREIVNKIMKSDSKAAKKRLLEFFEELLGGENFSGKGLNTKSKRGLKNLANGLMKIFEQFRNQLKGSLNQSRGEISKGIQKLLESVNTKKGAESGIKSALEKISKLKDLLQQAKKTLRKIVDKDSQSAKSLKEGIKDTLGKVRKLLNDISGRGVSSESSGESISKLLEKANSILQKVTKKVKSTDLEKRIRKFYEGKSQSKAANGERSRDVKRELAEALEERIRSQKIARSENGKQEVVESLLANGKKTSADNGKNGEVSPSKLKKLAGFEANSANSVSNSEQSGNSFTQGGGGGKQSNNGSLNQAQNGTLSYRSRGSGRAQRIINQIVERVQTNIQDGKKSMKMQLSPESLGEVKMKVTLEANKLTAQFKVENSSVKNTLTNHVEQLKNSLQQMGLEIDSMDISDMSSENEGQTEPWFEENDQFQVNTGDNESVEDDETSTSETNPVRTLRDYSTIELVA